MALGEHWRVAEGLDCTIIIALRRHLLSWAEEFPKLEPIASHYGNDPLAWWIDKDDRPDLNKPFLLLSMERLVRLKRPDIEKLVKLARRSTVILEESYVIQNPKADRTQVVREIIGAHHIGLTGTLIRGFSVAALSVLQWVFRSGSPAFPEYRADREGSAKRFEQTFTSWAVADDGTRKRVPVLKNPEKFYDMLRPLMARRMRGEPDVVRDIGDVQIERTLVDVELDPEHMRFYLTLVDQFTVWYRKLLEERGEMNKINAQEILVKLNYLIQGLVQPWKMPVPEEGEGDFIPPFFERRMTALQEWGLKKATEHVLEGRQVLIFSQYPSALDLISESCVGFAAARVHGGVSFEARAESIESFQNGETPLLCVSYGVGAESLNLGAAGAAILLEPNWVPSVMTQAEGRMTRGQVDEVPQSFWLSSPGTILEYMHGVARLKQSAMDAALDHIEQTVTGADISDLRQYAYGLAIKGDSHWLEPRKYMLDL